MAYELSFNEMGEKERDDYFDISSKLAAIESEIVKISEERAIGEAGWRKKENFLQTEKGKLETLLRKIRTGTVTEV